MAIVSEDRVISPGVSQAAATIRLVALRLSPVVMALVIEPWAAVAIALDVFRRPRNSAFAGTPEMVVRQRHVVNASVMLLGLAAVIIVALALTNQSARTWSDEVAWIAAAFVLGSLALSFSSMRGGVGWPVQMRVAHGSFLAGMAAILLSLAAAAWQLPR